jgi:hypothetical protein
VQFRDIILAFESIDKEAHKKEQEKQHDENDYVHFFKFHKPELVGFVSYK